MAEADPVRMTANTKAWSSRVLDKEYQKPLYSLNTYTDTQARLLIFCLKDYKNYLCDYFLQVPHL